MPAVDDEYEDQEVEEGENGDFNEDRELATAGKTNKSKKASKARGDGHRGLTRVNDDGELVWLATADSEGGKTSFIVAVYATLTISSSSGASQ